ncbi:MAG: ABC transporter ATP-binding protein [Planctomycetota bacterium]|jgi:ABC-2 type transport system ATP-binding protein
MILSVHGLRKAFGTTVALDGVSCEIGPGATGLLGPNGAGKTTLLRILLGLLPAEGQANVLGLDPTRQPISVRGKVGYMPESECLIPGLFGVDVVAYMGRLAGMPGRSAFKRAHEVMYFVGLGEERYREASEYSLGMQQRLKLATALVHDPELLFLDEPTNGLDPSGRDEMLALLRELSMEHGKNLVLSSHLLRDVEQVCTNVVMLKEGKLARQGPIDEMTSSQQGSFEVRVRGDGARFTQALRAEGAVAHGDGELLVLLPEGTGPEAIFRAARDSGVQVRGLRPTRRSLEDVFLEEVED